MGLLQRAIETYDNMISLAGIEREGEEPLAPIAHNTTRASIEITLDEKGDFINATKCDQKIVIPVTESSAGRTSGIRAHPLCDQLCYVADINSGKLSKKHEKYLEQLRSWYESEHNHPKVEAVYNYVIKGSVLSDLEKAGIIEPSEGGKLKDEKAMICWKIIGLGDESGPVWTDTDLHGTFARFYINCLSDASEDICYLDGNLQKVAKLHLKGINSMYSNAKIISFNDHKFFTYRGRFRNSDEAVTIGYFSSQKAHNAIKWLLANEKVRVPCGNRTFICWNPKGITTPKMDAPLLFNNEEIIEPTRYKKKLEKLINGFKNTLPDDESVIIAGFDATTINAGRLSITYYNELTGSDFLKRLKYWDETCCWYDNRWGVSSPLLSSIALYAFGLQRGDDDSAHFELDLKIKGMIMQRLIACRIDRSMFPVDVMLNLKRKADNLQILSKRNRSGVLFTACAVIRKFRIDHFKEEFAMSLDLNCQDRSYQFGRLLAVMEKIEKVTFDSSTSRESNAIRLQQVFTQRPGYAAKIIMDKLKSAYYPRLSPGSRVFYDRLIGNIMEQLSQFDIEEYDRPLTETYLLGYYLQKNELDKKKDKKSDIDERTEV